jgi:hypothetical protein
VTPALQSDYTAVGHLTLDVFEDGSRRPGGTVLYGALQAARLGLRAHIVTQGVPSEMEQLLAPYAGELELTVIPAASTTTLRTSGSGLARRQTVLAWAGPIERPLRLDTRILHLAPVARELSGDWRADGAFVGLTPQGLVRRWTATDPEATLADAGDGDVALAARCDALVVGEQERSACAQLIAAVRARDGIVAVTAGGDPCTILAPGSEPRTLHLAVLADPCDDLGAGDVFAAAFFVSLAEGRAPEAAAVFASAAARVRLQGAGPQAIGDRDRIEASIEQAAG